MISFENRLKSLKDRRQGTRERALLDNNLSIYSQSDVRSREHYEELSESAPIKYAIGAMAAVDSRSTQISIEEGERVADTLISMLATVGINAEKEIQGSVALDVHIEGHSDVDMLILKSDIVLVQTPKIDGSACVASDARPMKDIIRELRQQSETKLTSRYHQAEVNCRGNKSIALSGGSLKRKVDIVPACWYHTHEYQKTFAKHHKGVEIYHKGDHKLIGNQPFLHMKRINDKDAMYSGNLKRVVRLMKNLIADMPDYKKRIAKNLSSYDIAAIGFDMNDQLACPTYLTLALVEKLRAHLSILVEFPVLRDGIRVPDGSRKVFDNENKIEGLTILHSEVSDLAKSIYRSLNPYGLDVYNSQQLLQKQIFL
ncbi:hypothetical protein QTP81_16285 [Alteromonas sp. ASW11-36]|uniref:Nucleotidyltransferase n=1 Tax=Alteromonas arenosi TaxID=3055817 RepID=A0ABT7T131_9ALTE|nr:hypothetical protein [Alteromonas sp. ASW11-36]MDM7862165.1 hypothetical protein [Alteromonas sp. ASW11-36]